MNTIEVDNLTQILLTFLTWLSYQLFFKKYQFIVDGFSLVRQTERSMNSNTVSKIWVGMSATNIHLL